jgi:hypothetical protein
MAIGVRISSINLSGDTTDVTFLPTSGGTINLGTQVIPFNYISPNYQGTYQLYVPQYDYTYEIVIGASTVTGQTYMFLSTPTNSTNWGASTTSFIDMTAQVIDLDVDKSGWYESDWYPLTESGYAILFYNRDQNDYKKVRFLDTLGNLVGEYNCLTTNYNFNYMRGKIIYFNDRDNGILKYYDGYQVYTLTSDTASQSVNVLYDYDGVTSSNTFGVSITDTNTNVHTNYIMSGGSMTQFSTYDANTYNQQYVFYFDGSFIGELEYLTSGDMQTLKLYNGVSGSVLQTYDFTTGSTYNNWNIYPYGNNKIVFVFWNYADLNVDWLFIQYDGNTNSMTTLSHARGTNYQSWTLTANDNYNPNDGPSEAWVATLYNNDTNLNFGSRVNYCDLVYMLSGDTNINTYVYQNSGSFDKIINTYFVANNLAASYGDTGNGYVSIFTLNQSGFTVSATTLPSTINGYGEMMVVGEGFVFHAYEDNYTGDTLAHINKHGVVSDLIEHIPRPSGSNWDHRGGIFTYSNGVGAQYFIDGTSDLFQTNPPLPLFYNTNYYYPNNYFTPDFLRPSVQLFLDYGTYEASILTLTGFTSTFQLPGGGNGYNIEVGKDKFLYSYNDGSWIMNLYDFNFNLLNSYDTQNSSSWSVNGLKDRFIQVFNTGSNYTIVGIGPTGTTESTVTQFDSYNGFNDSIDWC